MNDIEHPMEMVYACAVCGIRRTIVIDSVGLNSFNLRRMKLRCPACQVTGATPKPPPPPDPKAKEIARWVPADYRDSDDSQFPVEQWANCKHWIPGQKGLLLFGPTRRCKSRIAYALAIKAIRNGSRVQCYDCRTFRAEVELRIAAGTLWDWYKDLELAIDVLLLDDLGKFKGEGKRIEEELFSVVKLRVESRRPMIITTNDTPTSLAGKFSGSIAEPMVARLMEVCSMVDFRVGDERSEMLSFGMDL